MINKLSNEFFFLQCGINNVKHLLFFQTTKCTCPTALCMFLVFEKVLAIELDS